MARRVLVADSPNFVPVLRLEANRLPPDPDVVSMMPYVLFKTSCICTLEIAARTNILRNEAIAQLALGKLCGKRFPPLAVKTF